jgi:hypothetical protein
MWFGGFGEGKTGRGGYKGLTMGFFLFVFSVKCNYLDAYLNNQMVIYDVTAIIRGRLKSRFLGSNDKILLILWEYVDKPTG